MTCGPVHVPRTCTAAVLPRLARLHRWSLRGRLTWRAPTTRLRSPRALTSRASSISRSRTCGSTAGTLSVRFTREWFEAALARHAGDRGPQGRARRRLPGVVLEGGTGPCADHRRPCCGPIRVRRDAYLYGPICVAESERGQDLPAALMSALSERLPGREGITFIRARQHARRCGRMPRSACARSRSLSMTTPPSSWLSTQAETTTRPCCC